MEIGLCGSHSSTNPGQPHLLSIKQKDAINYNLIVSVFIIIMFSRNEWLNISENIIIKFYFYNK